MSIKPNLIAAHCLIGLCALICLAACQTEKPKKQPAAFYDAVLGQIIYDRYYHCFYLFEEDKNLMKMDSAYRNRAVSEATFFRLVDAVKKKRMNMAPKFAITFHPDLNLYYREHAIPDEEKKDLLMALLSDTVFRQTFPATWKLDSLFTPCGLHAADFHIDFLQIDPPPPNWNPVWGSISLSKPLFNASKTRAVLYCEYHYESPSAEGVFVFVEKQEDGWKVYKYLLIWQS